MYRIVALLAVLLAACGGGGGSEEPTETLAPATNAPTSDIAGVRTQTPGSPTAEAAPGTYEVVDGDTLWDIAARFNTTVEALVELNGLASADDLQVGQTLRITATAGGVTTTATVAATNTPATQ